ncbi:50S ribosome-binding GTPase [Candidatus Bathyarchaeota archaeon]|nr:50S ribosome-binding GTPase [Candidatus Bathyarchaeota archaeon]
MVTNLPQEAKNKWNEVAQTRNPEERLRLMQEFLSLVPKHKGTEKLCAHVRTQISQLREEIERRKQMKRGTAPSYFIEKQGAAQIVILGPTNVGRSSLMRAVTGSTPDVAPYPFTTRLPVPGMLPYRDIQFQLVEAPPILRGASEGRGDGNRILSLARNADGLIIMVDLTQDPVENYLTVAGELEKARIQTVKPEGYVEIRRRGHGSEIQFIWEGELVETTPEEVVALLKEYRITSALVRIKGRVTIDLVEDAVFGSAVYRPTIILANKVDIAPSLDGLNHLREAARPLEVIAISVQKTQNLPELLGRKLFEMLRIIRIYTKEPGREPSPTPIVGRGRMTVAEVAKALHTDFYKRFKYAKLWGPSSKFPGEKVGLDRELSDGDIVELHI